MRFLVLQIHNGNSEFPLMFGMQIARQLLNSELNIGILNPCIQGRTTKNMVP